MKIVLLGAASAISMIAAPASAQAVAPPAPGQPTVEYRSQHMHMEMQTRAQVTEHVRKLFARFDVNRDGFISRDEVDAAGNRMHARMRHRMGAPSAMAAGRASAAGRAAAFDRLDLNHDGVITRDEFANARPRVMERQIRIVRGGQPGDHGAMSEMGHMGHGGMLKHMFAMADGNHDGRLSIDEATAAALHHFDMADTNHDGRLEPGERMQMHRAMMSASPR
jgi:Ca2+-binding EF-hand superfamily protein